MRTAQVKALPRCKEEWIERRRHGLVQRSVVLVLSSVVPPVAGNFPCRVFLILFSVAAIRYKSSAKRGIGCVCNCLRFLASKKCLYRPVGRFLRSPTNSLIHCDDKKMDGIITHPKAWLLLVSLFSALTAVLAASDESCTSCNAAACSSEGLWRPDTPLSFEIHEELNQLDQVCRKKHFTNIFCIIFVLSIG